MAFGCARALDCRWCLGQCGLWPTATRWCWAVGSICRYIQPSGEWCFGSLAVYARHTTAEGPGGYVSRNPQPLGIVVAVYTCQNTQPPGGSGPLGMCVGMRGYRDGTWLVAGSQDRGPAVAEVWVGVGLADFSGSKPYPRGF